MADIELVIKLSQESYNNLKIGCTQRVSDGEMIEVIKNGAPLPEGHGDLIDRAELHLELDSFMYGISSIHELIDEMKPIIEADKEQKDE